MTERLRPELGEALLIYSSPAVNALRSDGFVFKSEIRSAESAIEADLIAAGVIDPAKVSRTALQNAASIAGLMLTTEAIIADVPEEKGEAGGIRAAAWAAWEWGCNLRASSHALQAFAV